MNASSHARTSRLTTHSDQRFLKGKANAANATPNAQIWNALDLGLETAKMGFAHTTRCQQLALTKVLLASQNALTFTMATGNSEVHANNAIRNAVLVQDQANPIAV
jgi:hypothetical protein